jgi:uncharacterized protein YgfB (UPF0149 family)
MASLAPFNHLDRSFAAAGSPVDAAEAHGCLAGSLCAVAAYRFEHWLAEVMPEDEDADELLTSVQKLPLLKDLDLGAVESEIGYGHDIWKFAN